MGSLWGCGHAAQLGFQAVRSAWAMPTARRAGPLSLCELRRRRQFPPGHDGRTGPLARARRATARCDQESARQQPGHRAVVSPAQCPPPIPQTPTSSRDTHLPPTQAPATAGDHTGDLTHRQHAPNAEFGTADEFAECACTCAQIARFWSSSARRFACHSASMRTEAQRQRQSR